MCEASGTILQLSKPCLKVSVLYFNKKKADDLSLKRVNIT